MVFIDKFHLYFNQRNMQREQQQHQSLAFIVGQYLVVSTLGEEVLRLRVEHVSNLGRVYWKQLGKDGFPDNLRHSPLDSTTKIYNFMMVQKDKRVKFHGSCLVLRIDGPTPISIEMDHYVLQQPTVKKQSQIQEIEEKIFIKSQKKLLQNQLKFWSRLTLEAYKYKIHGGLITKLKDGWSQICADSTIKKNQVNTFAFKVRKFGGDLSIGLGVMQTWRRNEIYSGDLQHNGSIGIWSKPRLNASCVCRNGIKVQDWDPQYYIPANTIIYMTLDQYHVLTFQTDTFKISFPLTKTFFKEQLCIYCVMYNAGSQIQVLQQ